MITYNTSLNNVLVLDGMRGAPKLFFHIDILKFHDFSMILAFFSNSMIFPGLENAFFIFQVFHDFPGRWEPCYGSNPFLETLFFFKTVCVPAW